MNVKTISATTCAFLVGLLLACATNAEPAQVFVEKSVGTALVKMPVLPGFSRACDENQQFAQRAAALTPKTSEFITCFVPTSKWLDFQAGRATDLYPLIGVSVARPPAVGFTPEKFKEMMEAARKQLGDMLGDGSAEKRLAEQDAALARSGNGIQRDNFRQAYGGLFPTPQGKPSFAYLTARTVDVTEQGAELQLKEVVATGVVLQGGRLIMLSVVDGTATGVKVAPVQDIMRQWIHAFASLN
ncbi:hypothetical protein [Variovorax sp. GB1P17]|uniref:hypothetical protein n=1 Tax=Variovorax sp. GB1P17 TaxID=3443740 RepID=UPI003F45413D